MQFNSQKMIGRSPIFLDALALITRVARYDAPVLIQGETGTGKELAARSIHYQSARRAAPFIPLNCGALPDGLIESELFGAERGAYTDAREARAGLVAMAEGGTLFLDELDSLPVRAQVSLLRFLQDHSYRPVGGKRECHGDVRIVAAASPQLDALLGSGAFRGDLAFRLNVLMIEMPPLRLREGDAELLADNFIAQHARQYALPVRPLDPASREWLASYAWPGNVRELDNRIQRAMLLSDDGPLQLAPRAGAPCAPTRRAPGDGEPVNEFNAARERALASFERAYLERLMESAGGNVTRAARLAGKERRALGKLLKKHGLGHDAFDTR